MFGSIKIYTDNTDNKSNKYDEIKDLPFKELKKTHPNLNINVFGIFSIKLSILGTSSFSLFKSNKYPITVEDDNTLSSLLNKSIASLHNYTTDKDIYLISYYRGIRVYYSIHLPLIYIFKYQIPDHLLSKAITFDKALYISEEGLSIFPYQ